MATKFPHVKRAKKHSQFKCNDCNQLRERLRSARGLRNKISIHQCEVALADHREFVREERTGIHLWREFCRDDSNEAVFFIIDAIDQVRGIKVGLEVFQARAN